MLQMRARIALGTLATACAGALALAQPVFVGTDIFPPEEFAARRAKMLDRIGDAVVVLQGTTERPGEQPLRQANQFFYLTGVVEPRAIAVIDGRTKKTTVFLQPYSERRELRMHGPGLHPGQDAARSLGVDGVVGREEFAGSCRGSFAMGGPSTRRSGPKSSVKPPPAIRVRWPTPRRTTRGTAASRAKINSSRS